MNETLDIRDFSLGSNVTDSDRILLARANDDYFAGAITVEDFKDNFLKDAFATKDIQFKNVNPNSEGSFVIDNQITPYAKIVLEGTRLTFPISVYNQEDGSTGKILIFQTGGKHVVLNNMLGNIDMPTKNGTVALIEYYCLDSLIYCHSVTIIPDVQYNAPNKINDLSTVYYDSTIIQLTWSAPHGDQLSDKVDGYDIRYSNQEVNADSDLIWIGMTKLDQSNSIIPLNPFEIQNLTLSELKANQEYYIYVKSYQIINGARYYSLASNFAYGKTTSNASEEGKVYRIQLNSDQIHIRKNPNKDSAGRLRKVENLIDETNLNQFLDTGYIDTDNITYNTEWGLFSYGRDTAYMSIIIDLSQQYILDKLFMLPSSSSVFSIFTKKDFGYTSQRLKIVSFIKNKWSTIDFQNTTARFIILCCDQQQFCASSTNPKINVDEYGVPDPYYNWDLGSFLNMIVYGTSVSEKPDKIKPVAAHTVSPLTMDQFVCTNGHFYQSGRIHAMCSGEKVRLYGHLGQFGAFTNNTTLVEPNTLEDIKFRLNNIPWVINNGPGVGLQELLETTYKPYGLKPFITGTGVLDYCRLVWNTWTYNNCSPVDNYYFDNMWSPLPKNSKQGIDEYLNITTNPNNYRIYSKLAYALAAKYGKNEIQNSENFIWSSPDYPVAEPMETGLDLLSGFEYGNEVDRSWEGFINYKLPEEKAAVLISVYDANGGYVDLNGNSTYGSKNADNSFYIVSPGNASSSSGYEFNVYLHIRDYNLANNIPFDVLNQHIYCSNIWLDSYNSSVETAQYAIPIEKSLELSELNGQEVRKQIDFRNRYIPNKPFWITEFGYGEGGARGSQSRLQCHSIPGRIVNSNWTIPDRHRSDIKGAWTIRGFLYFMGLGVDMVNHYITMSDSEWFGGNGPGLEMFRWDEFIDNTPSAKYNAIQQYEGTGGRGGFNCFGLFGHPLFNGAYPISRSYWYIAQFRTLLKDYIFLGIKKYDYGEKVMIYCFRKKNEEKGAYVVYYNDDQNNGIANVQLELPQNTTIATLHTQYIPKLPDPTKISNRLGTDQLRTGLPTTRKEKYINGEWVIQNRKPDNINYESFAQGAATYPENPQEGDEVYVLPTIVENPYFPIVGPVCAKTSGYTGTLLGANQYDVQEVVNGELSWVSRYNTPSLTWRQVDAVCDYIEYTEEGQHGCIGDSMELNILQGKITINVDEIPKYILFDGIPSTTYESYVTDLSTKTINSTSIQLWWNNYNTKDTGYEVFMSILPETGYTLHSTVQFGTNTTVIGGLTPDSTYYFKIRPICNTQVGSMSDYISAKSYSFIPDITSFTYSQRTSSTITLNWIYNYTELSDFDQYSIYRDSGDGNFIIIENIQDISIKQYVDTNLIPGKLYNYKIRAYGLNGKSNFSEELNVSTLTTQESSPDILDVRTDKLGTKIKIKYNLELNQPVESLKNYFQLTEDNNPRLITGISIDVTNPQYLILNVATDSLSEYTKNYKLRLTYNAPETNYLSTIYGIKVNSFSDISIINIVGNFTNLEATYYINFTNDTVFVDNSEWNNIQFSDIITNQNHFSLIDSYGRDLGATIYFSGRTTSLNTIGVCNFTDIPDNAKSVGYSIGIPTNPVILNIYGLTNTNQYKVLLYASAYKNPGSVPQLHSFAQAKTQQIINGASSSIYSIITDNTHTSGINQYMSLDELVPITNGLQFELTNPNQATYAWNAGILNFGIIYEYKGDETPENTDVFIRNVSVQEDESQTYQVTTDTITLNLVYIGIPTMIRISESETFENTQWINFTNNTQYQMTEGFGDKIIYVQLKNDTSESNVKIINIEYVDPYIPLQLNQIFINNNAIETYTKDVQILIQKLGNPTHYKIAETIDDINNESTLWQTYPENNTINYSFLTDAVSETKTVYLKLKDNITETDVVYDEIQYIKLVYDTHTITINTDALQDSDIQVSIAKVKYNKQFALSLTADDTAVSTWNRLFNYCKQGYIDNNITVNNYWHKHMPNPQNGGYPSRQLTYTTGTGVRRIFPITSANSYNLHNVYWSGPITQPLVSASAYWPYLTWYEQEEINDFGGACTLHDVQDPALSTNGGTIAQIINGINDAEDNVIVPKLGYKLQIMAEPNGDAAYTSASEQVDYIKMITRQRAQYLGYDYINILDENINIDKLKVARFFNDGATFALRQKEIIDNFITPRSETVCMYGDLGMHGLSNSGGTNWNDIELSAKIQQLNWLCDTYGEYGDDSLWFASTDELLHYLHYRQKTKLAVSNNNQSFSITIDIPRLQNMYNKELTLNITNFNGNVSSIINETFDGFSYSISQNAIVINCNSSENLINNAEKYVTIFEESRTSENLRDAQYMVQLLAQRLQEPYITRIEAFTKPNVITSFQINNGNAATTTTNITIDDIIYSGETPTHYKISETLEGIESGSWIAYDDSIQFTINDTLGEHIVYLQLQNTHGASNIVYDTITYTTPVNYMYYGFYNDGQTDYSLVSASSIITAVTSGSIIKTELSTLGKTAVSNMNITDRLIILIPQTSQLTVLKDDGFGGKVQFQETAGMPNTASNGEYFVTIDSVIYKVYGEFIIGNDTEIYIYIE